MQPSSEQEIQELEARFEARDERHGRAFVPLADAHRRAGSLDRAVELVEEGLERHPDLIAGQLVGGRVFLERGDVERAERAFARVLELDGEHPEALAALAEICEEEGREAEARDFYHRWALTEPDDERARESLRRLKRRHFEDLLGAGKPAPPEPVDEPRAPEPAGKPAPPETTEEPAPPEPAARPAPPAPAEEPASPEPMEEPAPPVGEADDEAPAVYTRTMGELYARQGLTERAVDVFRTLVKRNPDDRELRERLEELEAGGPTPAVPPDAGGASAAGVSSDEEVEDLARDWAAGPDETGALDSPFTWGEEESAGEPSAGEEVLGATAAAYFDRLLEETTDIRVPEDAWGDEEPGTGAEDEGDDGEDGEHFRRWLDELEP